MFLCYHCYDSGFRQVLLYSGYGQNLIYMVALKDWWQRKLD
jgi:hypothetical protein